MLFIGYLIFRVKSYDNQYLTDCYQDNFDLSPVAGRYFVQIPAGKAYCNDHSVVIASNTSIIVDYYNSNYRNYPIFHHFEDPFAIIQPDTDQNKIISKISAASLSEPFTLQLIEINASKINGSDLSYSIFSTQRFFCQRFVAKHMEDSDSNILIRRSMHLISFTGYNINSTLGNFSNETALLTVDLNCEKSSQRGDYYLAYYDNNESITKSYFQMEKKYLIPTKSGVYTQSQVEDFTSLHHPFYNELEFDPYDLSDNTISCLDNEIWSPDFVNYDLGLKYTDSKVFTIQPGKSQCLYGNFVFNSKDDFIATVVYNDTKHYNVYTKQNAPKTILETYENPFTITTKTHDERLSQLIKLECKSKTEACKVQAVSVLPPIQKRLFMTPMKIESTFTTKTNFSIEKEITIDKDEIEIFSITVHNNKKFNVTVSSDNKEISNYLTTSNEFTTNEVSHNTVTIYPYYDLFKFIREEENLTTFKLKAKVKVQIVPSEENSTEEEGDEEIFENDLFLRLPSNGNGNSKEDVIEFNKKEEKLNRGLSGIILILAIILTIIVAVGVFIFIVYKVIEKKKKQSMKPTQEEIVSDDENEGEQHENISNSLDSNEI